METVIEKAPWMVSLGSKDGTQWGHGCGGTIIGPHAILTAAHCKSVMWVHKFKSPLLGCYNVMWSVPHLKDRLHYACLLICILVKTCKNEQLQDYPDDWKGDMIISDFKAKIKQHSCCYLANKLQIPARLLVHRLYPFQILPMCLGKKSAFIATKGLTPLTFFLFLVKWPGPVKMRSTEPVAFIATFRTATLSCIQNTWQEQDIMMLPWFTLERDSHSTDSSNPSAFPCRTLQTWTDTSITAWDWQVGIMKPTYSMWIHVSQNMCFIGWGSYKLGEDPSTDLLMDNIKVLPHKYIQC